MPVWWVKSIATQVRAIKSHWVRTVYRRERRADAIAVLIGITADSGGYRRQHGKYRGTGCVVKQPVSESR